LTYNASTPTRLALACCLLAPVLAAQPSPQTPCSSLPALTGYEFSVIAAVLHPAAGNVPEFCRVTGQVPPEIRFEVALPSNWSQRLLMAGNGSHAGQNLEDAGRGAARNNVIRRGFAFAQTNTGHDAAAEPLGTLRSILGPAARRERLRE